MAFDTYAAFQRILNNEEVCKHLPNSLIDPPNHQCQISPPLAAILALTELIQHSDGTYCPSIHPISPSLHPSQAGTMFELVKALDEGAEDLKKQASNPISLNAGCELFTAFVTLFPHDSAVCLPAISSVNIFSTILRLELRRSEEGTHTPGSKLCGRSPHLSQQNR